MPPGFIGPSGSPDGPYFFAQSPSDIDTVLSDAEVLYDEGEALWSSLGLSSAGPS